MCVHSTTLDLVGIHAWTGVVIMKGVTASGLNWPPRFLFVASAPRAREVFYAQSQFPR